MLAAIVVAWAACMYFFADTTLAVFAGTFVACAAMLVVWLIASAERKEDARAIECYEYVKGALDETNAWTCAPKNLVQKLASPEYGSSWQHSPGGTKAIGRIGDDYVLEISFSIRRSSTDVLLEGDSGMAVFAERVTVYVSRLALFREDLLLRQSTV